MKFFPLQDCVRMWLPTDPSWVRTPWDDAHCSITYNYVCECT